MCVAHRKIGFIIAPRKTGFILLNLPVFHENLTYMHSFLLNSYIKHLCAQIIEKLSDIPWFLQNVKKKREIYLLYVPHISMEENVWKKVKLNQQF